MISSDLYCKGVKVWIPDPKLVWIGGTIVNIIFEKRICKVEKDNGDIVDMRWPNKINVTESDLPYLRNPIILIGQKDLTSLSYLNEPEVLYNLQIRFLDRREIYTYCGIVLVAINPYKELPIYGNCIVDTYHTHDFSDLDPHIFAVGENAFRRMSSFNENQSIIVSGESGAGKTVSAKYIMRYFALVGGSRTIDDSNDNETTIERKVLSSNPIMEAFGNAKTVRNDNSSRFGKYLEIEFNCKNQIFSANMHTYLLEKSRVVYQNLGERNYHIFYQLVRHSQSGDDLLVNTGLVDNADNYSYLNSGDTTEINGLDDLKEFVSTKNSFLQLGFSKIKLQSIFEILAALLHLGNIQFISNETEDECEIKNRELLRLACHQLGCSSDQMEIWLRFRSISTLQETLHKPLTKKEAGHFRDALVKSIYSNLFKWIVKNINQSLCSDKSCAQSINYKKQSRKFIGVLDIYGFETFDENSFEQFCINFANEKLQQQFNLHVFKLEQEEYIKEGLEWTIIDYYNNQPCIDLIESKLGLFDLLDEECKMLKASDDNWCCKIYSQHLKKSIHFSKPKMSNKAFIVHHFAGQVQYECCGFIEKNRDTVLEEQINLLKASDVLIVAELYADEVTLIKGTGDNYRTKGNVNKLVKSIHLTKLDNSRKMKRTVGYQFRNSLKQLMDTLNETNPHYVRCIKPNDLKLPFTFCPERAVQQLRACGVLETIRLSAAGYPSRWAYNDFYPRYCILLSNKNLKDMNVTNGSQKIVQSVIKNEDAFRFGYKKLFFRPGHVAYLEKLRCDKINESVTLIQKVVRGWMARKTYLRMQSILIKLQSMIRRKMARESALAIRRFKAASKIQSICRMYICRTKYNNMKRSIKIIQKWWRVTRLARIKLAYKRESQVILCQSYVRAFLCRRRYLQILRGIILLQSHYRRRKAKVELRLLKLEAKSVYHFKLVNKGLENKIIELTQRLDEKSKEVYTINVQIEKNKKVDAELHKQIKSEAMKTQQVIVHNLQNEISQLKKETNKEIVEKKILYMEKESLDNKYKKKIFDFEELIESLTARIKTFETELNIKNEELASLRKCTPDVDLISKEQLIKEQMDHQRLIQEYGKLDMKYQNLSREFHFMKSGSLVMKNNDVKLYNTEYSTSENESISIKNDADTESFSEEEIKNTKKFTSHVEGIDFTNEKSFEDNNNTGDLTVIMQLQMRVNSSSEENNQLKERIQELENKLIEYKDCFDNQSQGKRTQDMLNMELFSLMKEIKELDNNGIVTILIDQISDLKKQLLQQMDESQKLKTSMFSGRLGKLGDAINLGFEDTYNEEKELKLVCESQKAANRKMLKEIDEMRSKESIYKKEIFQLKHDKEHLQLQMGKNLKLTPKERVDKFIQNEFSRILSENMKLRDSTDKVIAESIRLKRGLKYFAHRLQQHEGPLVPNEDRMEDLLTIVDDVINKSRVKSEGLKDYIATSGLIDLNLSELPVFIKKYINEMSPDQFSKFEIYHVIVFVIFMITKKYDSFKEEDYIIKFLTKIISSLKNVIRKHKDDLDFLAMYISNIFCLLNLFRQYNNKNLNEVSKDLMDKKLVFVTFDLSQFIGLLEDLCIYIFQFIMTFIRTTLLPQSLCIDAILLYEGIKTLMSKECLKDFSYLETQKANTSFNVLIKHLQSILEVLSNHKVAVTIINQIFFHITYIINAYCLNTLLFRTDLCYFSKGVQIKFNLSNLENWLRNQNLGHNNLFRCLQPMVEAVQLLQTLLKSDDDADVICKMCDYLNSSQIIKILHNFNPLDGWGCPLPSGLIAKTEAILSLKESGKQYSKIIETSTSVPVPIELPFIINTQQITEMIIPQYLYLPCMKILTDQDLR